MKPRIEFHCNNNLNLIKGYEFDDLFQELSCKLWKCRIPDDIEFFDYRFLKYMDTMFRFCLYDLSRRKMSQKKHPSGEIEKFFRDILDNSTSFSEEFNELL